MIQPWQMNVLNKLQGIKSIQPIWTMAGRRTGKSQMNSQAFMRLWDDIHNRPVGELKLSQGTIYGSRYYCIEPVGGSWARMELWCMQAFGETTGSIWAEEKAPDPAQRWYMNNRKFWFRDEADQLMFVMKWR